MLYRRSLEFVSPGWLNHNSPFTPLQALATCLLLFNSMHFAILDTSVRWAYPKTVFKKYVCLYVFERVSNIQRKTQRMFHLLIHSPKWTKSSNPTPKPGTGNSIQISHMNGRDSITWYITCCPLGCTLVGSWNRKSGQDVKAVPVMWDAGLPNSVHQMPALPQSYILILLSP